MPRKKGERVKGSWRDKGKGECFTRTNKSGAPYVVCNDPPRGSKGQAGVYKTKKMKKQKADVGQQVKERGAVKKIQAVQRGRQVRGKEVDFGDIELKRGKKINPKTTAKGDLYLEVVKPFGKTTIAKKKGLYKVKNIPAKEGTGSVNTEKFNLYKKGSSGEETQFNPYSSVGERALKDGSVRLVRKKI